MRDDFESYKTELDRLRLTEESKKALASRLTHRRAAQKTPRRLARTVRMAAAVAAVICLLATAGYAAVAAAPTLLGSIFEGGAAYEQSSGFVGKSVDNNGWVITITDCVGDDREMYVGLELAAPEGTVLDEEDYCFGEDNYTLDFFSRQGGQSWGLRQIPDDDPTDNRIAFFLHMRNLFESLDNNRIRLVLPELRYMVWNMEEEKMDYIPVCSGKWNFGVMTIPYPDSTIRLTPDRPVTTLGVEAVITELTVSPLSVCVRIEGDAFKGHHGWVPRNAPDGWYGCIEYQEIVLRFDDGTALIVDQANSDLSGSGCSGGTDPTEDGWLVLRRTYSGNINGVSSRLVDVDRVVSVSVCGVEIPLR